MVVLISNKNDEDPIKIERANINTNFFKHSRAANSAIIGGI